MVKKTLTKNFNAGTIAEAIMMTAKALHVVNCTVKPILSSHSKEDQKFGLKTDYRLMQVKSIGECAPFRSKVLQNASRGSILQYF